jgi:tRNA(Ile)-lysidine synthase
MLNLPCTIGTVSPAEHEEWHGLSEASARESRYRFLRRVAAEVGADRIALGHTLDDQAETVLLHLIRGSGIDGLSGMRSRAGDLIRPLLGLRRVATEGYCADRRLIPREDATNRDPRFLRNRVRHEVLPALAALQPDIASILARSAEVLAADAAFLHDAAEQTWQDLAPLVEPDRVTLARHDLRRLPPALRSRILRRAISLVGLAHPDAQLDADSLIRLDRVIKDRSGSVRLVQLSTGATARCDRLTVAIMRGESA